MICVGGDWLFLRLWSGLCSASMEEQEDEEEDDEESLRVGSSASGLDVGLKKLCSCDVSMVPKWKFCQKF